MTTLADVKQELAEVKSQNTEILALLQQLVAPANSLDVHRKSEEVLKALRSGNRGNLREVLKKINGE